MPKTKRPKKIPGKSFDDYRPIKNHINKNASFGGCLFETYGEEREFVRQQATENIWTIIEGDDGELYTIAGFHFVNRIGFLLTKDPWESDTIEFDQDDRRIHD